MLRSHRPSTSRRWHRRLEADLQAHARYALSNRYVTATWCGRTISHAFIPNHRYPSETHVGTSNKGLDRHLGSVWEYCVHMRVQVWWRACPDPQTWGRKYENLQQKLWEYVKQIPWCRGAASKGKRVKVICITPNLCWGSVISNSLYQTLSLQNPTQSLLC